MRWYQYLFGHKQRIALIKLHLMEIERQESRIATALQLHRDVLYNYGIEYQSKLATIDEIVQDTKAITIINYLNI